MRTRHLLIPPLLIGITVLLAACDVFVETVEPTPTLISRRDSVRQRPSAPVVRGTLTEAIRTTARVEAMNKEELFFKTDGRVKLMHVRDGDTVTAGQILAELETGRLESDIASAQESVNNAELRLDAARQRAVNERSATQQAAATAELILEDRREEFAVLLGRATDEQLKTLAIDAEEFGLADVVDIGAAEAEAAMYRARKSVAEASGVVAQLVATGAFTIEQAASQAQAELSALRAQLAEARNALVNERKEAGRLSNPDATVGTEVQIAGANSQVSDAQRSLAAANQNLRALEAGGETAQAAARDIAQARVDTAVAGTSAAEAGLAAAAQTLLRAQADQTNAQTAARARAVDEIEQIKFEIAATQLTLASARTALDEAVNSPTPKQVADAEAALAKAGLTRDDIVRTGSNATPAAREKAEIDFQIAQRTFAEAIKPATAEAIASARAEVDRLNAELTLVQNSLNEILAGQSEAAAVERRAAEFVADIDLAVTQAVAGRDAARGRLQDARATWSELIGSGSPDAAVDRLTQDIRDNRTAAIATARADVASALARVRARRTELNGVGAVASTELQELAGSRADTAQANVDAAQADIGQYLAGRSEREALDTRTQQILAAAQNSLPAADASLSAAEADLRAKQARYAEFTNPPTLARLRVGLSNVQVAELDLEISLDKLDRIERGESATDLELQILDNDLERARIGFQSLQQQQAENVIVAPINGQITFTRGRAGSQVRAFQEVIGLADASELLVEVRISETDQAKLSVGQPVDVALDAFPGVKFPGAVASIPRTIVTQTGQTVRIPTATLDVPFDREGVRMGMLARVNITLQVKDDVLKIPITAVKSLNERTFVETIVNEQRRSLPVVTGIKSDTEIEIISGLDEGQVIFTSP